MTLSTNEDNGAIDMIPKRPEASNKTADGARTHFVSPTSVFD